MNKETFAKLGMGILGIALTIASSIVNSKNQDAKLKKQVAEEVAKALEAKTKES